MIKSASVSELDIWLKDGNAILVDVREPSEYAQGFISGATLVPLATVTVGKIPPFKGKKLVMQCRSGGRSRKACENLTKEMPDLDIYNLEGGILAWIEAGYKVAV